MQRAKSKATGNSSGGAEEARRPAGRVLFVRFRVFSFLDVALTNTRRRVNKNLSLEHTPGELLTGFAMRSDPNVAFG